MPLMSSKVLAHNLFHKICEEARPALATWQACRPARPGDDNNPRGEERDYTSRAGLALTKLTAGIA
jgi:hypothetical protein